MKATKLVLIGLIAGFVSFVAGSALYMNPLTSGLYAQYGQSACSKSMELFGGVGNWLLLMLLGGLVSTVFVAFLYHYAEKGLPVKSVWKKGLFFGLLLWLVAKLPASYYAWLLYNYADVLNVIETVNGLIGGLVAGIVLAVLYEKWRKD